MITADFMCKWLALKRVEAQNEAFGKSGSSTHRKPKKPSWRSCTLPAVRRTYTVPSSGRVSSTIVWYPYHTMDRSGIQPPWVLDAGLVDGVHNSYKERPGSATVQYCERFVYRPSEYAIFPLVSPVRVEGGVMLRTMTAGGLPWGPTTSRRRCQRQGSGCAVCQDAAAQPSAPKAASTRTIAAGAHERATELGRPCTRARSCAQVHSAADVEPWNTAPFPCIWCDARSSGGAARLCKTCDRYTGITAIHESIQATKQVDAAEVAPQPASHKDTADPSHESLKPRRDAARGPPQ